MTVKINSKEKAREFLDKYNTFLFDCDGVLWQGSTLLPHVIETIELLRKEGKNLVFVTNNSTKSRESYAKKFSTLGIKGVSKAEIFGSAYASAVYIAKDIKKRLEQENKKESNSKINVPQKVFFVGEDGLKHELNELGIETINEKSEECQINGLSGDAYFNSLAENIHRIKDVGYVVVGLDRELNYTKIAWAQAQLIGKNNQDVKFIATNIDSTFPTHGKLLPGAGTVVESVATASGRRPMAMGKPSQDFLDIVTSSCGIDNRSTTCMIGDRLNTDIEFGNIGGLDTLLVLTGVSTENDLKDLNNKLQTPSYYADGLGVLYTLLKAKNN